MIEANELKRGMVIKMDGTLYSVLDTQFLNPGNWRAMRICKLRNLDTGSTSEKRFRTADRVEDIFLDKVQMEYLYFDGTNYVFMDTQTYEQHFFSEEILGDQAFFLQPNVTVIVLLHEKRPVSIELPAFVELRVKETQGSMKGATATNQYKPAVLETGLKVNIPPFVEEGEIIRVDTRTGEYLERAR